MKFCMGKYNSYLLMDCCSALAFLARKSGEGGARPSSCSPASAHSVVVGREGGVAHSVFVGREGGVPSSKEASSARGTVELMFPLSLTFRAP